MTDTDEGDLTGTRKREVGEILGDVERLSAKAGVQSTNSSTYP